MSSISPLSSVSGSISPQNCGHFNSLPTELILLIFSSLTVPETLQMASLNKAFSQLFTKPHLWKILVKNYFSDSLFYKTIVKWNRKEDELHLITNWKPVFQLDWKLERNFLLFRKRACSQITFANPSPRSLTRTKSLSEIPVDLYLSFDFTGDLQAVFYKKAAQKVYNIRGNIQEMTSQSWNVRTTIQRQFISRGVFDGHYPFSPVIKLKSISSPNVNQTIAFYDLQRKINLWFAKTRLLPDAVLERQVQATFTHLQWADKTKITSVRGGEHLLKREHLAYFIFLGMLMCDPVKSNQ